MKLVVYLEERVNLKTGEDQQSIVRWLILIVTLDHYSCIIILIKIISIMTQTNESTMMQIVIL